MVVATLALVLVVVSAAIDSDSYQAFSAR
jgi:hypothetical protein